MKTSILLLTLLGAACAPRYTVQIPPEDQPQPITLGGKSLVAISRDGRRFVWYAKPEDVVLAMLRQVSAGAKAAAEALAAETKAHEKCEQERGVLMKLTGISSFDPPKPAAAAAKP